MENLYFESYQSHSSAQKSLQLHNNVHALLHVLSKWDTYLIFSHLQLELERVIGLTSTSASGLSCNADTGELAYLAGAVVVVYNVNINCQTRFLMAPKSAKAFTCIAYSSQGGRLLAAGEVCEGCYIVASIGSKDCHIMHSKVILYMH
jgi:hypothetical protein